MDFGDILKNWEKDGSGRKTKPRLPEKKESSMESLLDLYSPDGGVIDSKIEPLPREQSLGREKMRRRKADLVLDLHGMTANEGQKVLKKFIRRSYKSGANKILVIHGKGNHTKGQAVLKPMVRAVLEESPYIGDIGTPERRDGGSGATWAVIRQRSL